jgi:hypothetical protein
MNDPSYKGMIDHGLEKTHDRWYGNYRGIVVDNKDPQGLGRIKVRVPVVAGNDTLPIWCYPESLGAGQKSGFFWPPDEGDGVNVWFEMGDTRFPNYTGGWFGDVDGVSDVPDEFAPEKGKSPTRRGFRLKNGMFMLFETKEGEELVQIAWSNGDTADAKKAVFAMDKNGSISMVSKSGRRLQLDEENKQFFYSDVDDGGNAINTLSADLSKGWVISAAGGGTVACTIAMDPSSQKIALQAQGEVNVSAPSASFECGTVAIGGSKAIFSQVLGEPLMLILTQFITQVAAITVNTGVGPSSPPNNADQISALSAQLITMLSIGHKVSP